MPGAWGQYSIMGSNDNFASRLLATIASLPVNEQGDAIQTLISVALKQMPLESIYSIRAEITEEFTDALPIVKSTLDLIDGQLALREIAGGSSWR
jgi:hypothetical protein